MIRNGSGVTLNLFKEIYTNKEFLFLIWIDATLALLMVLPSSIFFSLDFKNKETGKSDIQTYIDELEKIFDKYNARSKESAVDKKIIKSDISNLKFSKFKKLFYTDILKPSYIKSIKGKWYYFEHKDKKNPKIGLTLAMYTLIVITVIWNAIMSPIIKEDSKIIEYKVNNNITVKMPDCMKLDEESHTNNDIETYYYNYLSQNVNKSNIEVVEISYYPKYDYDFKYEEFKELLTDSLSKYDILLTNNFDAVKPTIVSRCQKIFVNSSKERKEKDENIVIESTEIIENLEKYGIESIAKFNKIYTIINDREKFLKVLYVMMDKYKDALYELVNDENIKKDDIIFMKNDINSISKKILIIDKYISLTSNYLNKNLTIDRFIIEMWG